MTYIGERKRAYDREYYHKHKHEPARKERARNNYRNYYRKSDKAKRYMHKYVFKRRTGITLEERDIMFEKQGGKCLICETITPPTVTGWVVDHCHIHGHIRGILCSHCNQALGLFKDNPVALERAASYIRERNNAEFVTQASTYYGSGGAQPRLCKEDGDTTISSH